ncbi:hypothetical protein [Hyphococcus sp.]|jgi:hypothetical protein|uniref:hypothetical protein n=1 Tax=Hyphococcus sp. TaxID=2038636 RepID=UPI003D0AF66A
MQKKNVLFVSLSTIAIAGCTTMESIQSGDPSYVVSYTGADRNDLRSCAQAKFDEKSAYSFYAKEVGEYSVIEAYAEGALALPGGSVTETGVPYFATRFYSDRVEIYGRYSISGDYGKGFVPYIKECVAELGGEYSDG